MIIFPFLAKNRNNLHLQDDPQALLIFDVFKGQTRNVIKKLLKENNSITSNSILVPNNHINLSQSHHVSLNKSARCYIARRYQDWRAGKILEQLNRRV